MTDQATTERDSFHMIGERLRANGDAAHDIFASACTTSTLTMLMHPPHLIRSNISSSSRVDIPGGAGANIAVALSRLGLRSATAGAVGSDHDGEALMQALQDSVYPISKKPSSTESTSRRSLEPLTETDATFFTSGIAL